MKKVLAVFVLLLVSSLAAAQGLHGKILIVSDSGSTLSPQFVSIISSYHGNVDTFYHLPSDISGYDAVSLLYYDPPLAEQLSLITYLKAGGKLYLESNHFLRGYHALDDSSAHPDDTLCTTLGLRWEIYDAVFIAFVDTHGVDSEYTSGIFVSHPHDDPTHFDAGGTYYPSGNIVPVLLGKERDFGQSDVFAWIPADTSFKAVFFKPIISDAYGVFVRRTFCSYFGLCDADVSESSPINSDVCIRSWIDGEQTNLEVLAIEPTKLDVINSLGISIICSNVLSGKHRISLSSNLAPGLYFARVQSKSEFAVKPFVILPK